MSGPTTAPILTTRRLILRPLGSSDVSAIARLAHDPTIATNTASIRYPYHAYWARSFVRRALAHAQSRCAQAFAITLRGNPRLMIGVCSVSPLCATRPASSFGIGYWLGAPWRRRGFVSEAVRAAIAFAFETGGAQQIEAECRPSNVGSRRVLERAGFRFIGCGTHCSSYFYGRRLPTLRFRLSLPPPR